ncbi:putative protein-serine/threonine phosphatase [Helianthus annuus]|nr:putative protein-serine/threonine phosphatase [Helianthus annuus]
MLNMRCLSIVFDLDETLIVANTMRSFEDRIEVLTGWIGQESDPVRVSGMTSELKRYVEDRALLKQYAENDVVTDSGQTYNVKLEDVPVNAAGNERVQRPVIRLPEKNVVLTRINPEVEYRSILSSSRDWPFSYEVLFTGEKVGVGMGKTRKDAQQQAAENALRSLADKYVAHVISQSETVKKKDPDNEVENGFLWESDSDESPVKDASEVAEMRRSSNSTGQLVQKSNH